MVQGYTGTTGVGWGEAWALHPLCHQRCRKNTRRPAQHHLRVPVRRAAETRRTSVHIVGMRVRLGSVYHLVELYLRRQEHHSRRGSRVRATPAPCTAPTGGGSPRLDTVLTGLLPSLRHTACSIARQNTHLMYHDFRSAPAVVVPVYGSKSK